MLAAAFSGCFSLPLSSTGWLVAAFGSALTAVLTSSWASVTAFLKLPPTAKIAVVSANGDVYVPTKLQKDIVKVCKANKIPVKYIEVEGDHSTLPPPNRILVGLDFVVYKNIK